MAEEDYGMLFPDFPDRAKIWTFVFDRDVSGETVNTVAAFLSGWQAHGQSVAARVAVLRRRLLVIAAEPEALSGCGVDAMFRAVKMAAADMGLRILDGSYVHYLGETEVESRTRNEFAALVRDSGVHTGTTVFDTSVATLQDLRNGRWELPFSASWHARAFPL